jgi:hypothetical protein
MNDDKLTQLEKRIAQLERTITTANTATPEYARSVGDLISTTSGKAAGSENQAVDEGGSATYNVLGAPDGFIRIGDRNVPYYN